MNENILSNVMSYLCLYRISISWRKIECGDFYQLRLPKTEVSHLVFKIRALFLLRLLWNLCRKWSECMQSIHKDNVHPQSHISRHRILSNLVSKDHWALKEGHDFLHQVSQSQRMHCSRKNYSASMDPLGSVYSIISCSKEPHWTLEKELVVKYMPVRAI